jgi:nitrite reductase/ring-hydroxylating ferredoxin subunit
MPERDQFTWHKVLDATDEIAQLLPLNRAVPFEVGRKKMCLVRHNDELFATASKCPHNGASLEWSTCTDKAEVVCPLHRYRFDLKTGRSTNTGGYFLEHYPVEMREDGIYVGIKISPWKLF